MCEFGQSIGPETGLNLYYRTQLALASQRWLNSPDPNIREGAENCFQRWLDKCAPKIFPKDPPGRLTLPNGAVLQASGCVPDEDCPPVTIGTKEMREWVKSNEPDSIARRPLFQNI